MTLEDMEAIACEVGFDPLEVLIRSRNTDCGLKHVL